MTDDRRDLETTREVVARRWVIEERIDFVTPADVERELDAGVDLRLVELREVRLAAPIGREVVAGVDGVGRVHAKGIEPVAVESQRAFIGEFDRHRETVVTAVRSLEAEVIDPAGVVEG